MVQGKNKSDTQDLRKKPFVAFNTKKSIALSVTKQVAEKIKAVIQAKTNGNEVEAYIMSIFNKYAGKASVSGVTIKAPAAATPSSLKSHIKRAKNINNN